MSTQPDGSLNEFMVLGHALREASTSRDFVTLANLITDFLSPDAIDMVLYFRSPAGFLTRWLHPMVAAISGRAKPRA
jgi:hypothetical protein